VLSELMNDDGTVMRGGDVAAFATRHNLKRISIADLISYRQAREKLVDRISEFSVTTEIGPLKAYAYMTHFDQVHHMALVYGRIGDGKNVPTRLHRANIIRDMFGGTNSVPKTLQHFKREGQGVIVILRDGSVGVPVSAIPKNGDKNGEAGSDAERQRQWREIGLGAQILKDLGITSIRLLTSAEHRYVGLAGFGIEIVSTEPIKG
jgi:3,4-dihydroxy 2-butanone 4-phosphate synthase/GTP cyclohydrolase II